MKLAATVLVLVLAACGSSDTDLRSDPDVQAILDGYERLGATDAELDEMVDEIDAALDVYDSAAERRAYLRDLRDSTEQMVEAVEP